MARSTFVYVTYIRTTPEKLWQALIDPDFVKQYFFGVRFDTDWKPKNGFPVRAGWLRTIRRAHAKLHRGLDVRVPVLLLRSSHSLLKTKVWTPEAMRADTVLDVAQMAKWAPKIGPNVTVVAIEGGMHDLFLSAPAVRERALSETDSWLEGLRHRERIVE